MKILVLSFYFKPDLCAGSFRATSLVDSLRKIAPADAQIDVITTLPNRYHSFTVDAPATSRETGLSIYRIALPDHKSGILDQSKAFVVFAKGAIGQVRGRDYDVVVATSSRLMTAALGAWIATRKKARLYLDIRDIFVDTLKDVLPRKVSVLSKPLFSALEKWTVNHADKVNLVSPGFREYFSRHYPRQRFSYFTNGIDGEFVEAAPVASLSAVRVAKRPPYTVVYAGNLGEGQGLHVIVPELAKSMEAVVRFKIVGDGGRRLALESALKANGVSNVDLLAPVHRDELLDIYGEADVLFLHLNDYEAFKKVLPSKLFEYAAMGKPVWAGVAGYAAEFVRSEITNAAVFTPCSVADAVRSFQKLILVDRPRIDFVAKYARANLSRKMAEDILSVANGS